MPQLIPVEPPTQGNHVLSWSHIPVTVQRGQAGHKTLCKVTLGQASIGSWSVVSKMSVFHKSPFQLLSSPEPCPQ